MRSLTFTFLCYILLSATAFSQIYEKTDQRPALLFEFQYGVGVPTGDLSDRFGFHNYLGFSPKYMLSNGISFGLHGHYFFGNDVKEEILQNVRTTEGFIIGRDQFRTNIVLKERGWNVVATIGKIFDLSKKPARMGPFGELGVGMMWHKIRLQDDENTINQILDPYHKGYDRLTGGFAVNLDAGFQYMAANRGLNFKLGVKYVQGFTSSWRTYNYDTQLMDTNSRLDGMFNLFAAFILPIYQNVDDSKIYY